MKNLQALIDRAKQRSRLVGFKDKARASFGLGVALLHRVFQAADRAHDWNRAVLKAKHLIKSARFEWGGNKKNVGPRLNLVSEGFIETKAQADPVGMSARGSAKELFVARFAGAEQDELDVALHQRCENTFNQIKSFLRCQT